MCGRKTKTIREAVRAAAERHGLTAYAVAKATDGAVSDDMLKRFFEGRSDLTSGKVDAVLRVLGLVLGEKPARRKTRPGGRHSGLTDLPVRG